MSEAGQLAQERWTVRAIQTSATALNDKPGTDYAIARWGGGPSPVLYSISLACANRIADELNAALEARAEASRQRIAELELEMERDNLKRDISWRSEVALTEQHRAEAAEAEQNALRARAAYVQHLPDCEHLFNRSMTCSCGLDALTTPVASQCAHPHSTTWMVKLPTSTKDWHWGYLKVCYDCQKFLGVDDPAASQEEGS